MESQNKRIAIPLINGVLSLHFGKCNQFSIVEIKDNEVVKEELLSPPEHTPGSFPNFLISKNVNTLLVGGIGGKAIDILNDGGVDVIKGLDALSRQELVDRFIAGELEAGENACNHDEDC